MMLFRAAVSIALTAMQQSFPFVVETTSSYLESLLEASLDDGVLCSHTVSHQLRALLSPLLMPQQQPPAVPAKVIYIAGKKNWTIATTLVAILDDNYNDLSTTAPYVDPCRITQYDLGFPLGLVAEYGGFFQSIYAPLCLPPIQDSCTTLYDDPWQYLLDIITDDDADAIIDRYIPRDELTDAFWIWTYDQIDAWQQSLYETVTTALQSLYYDQYDRTAACQWLHDNKIVAEPQWWNNQLCSILHWFWQCLVQSGIFFQNASVAAVVYLHGAAVQCTMVGVEAFLRGNIAALQLVLACGRFLFRRYQNSQLTASEMMFYGAYVVVFLVIRRQLRRRAATTTTTAAAAPAVVVVPQVVVVVPNAPAPTAAPVAPPAPVDAAPSDEARIEKEKRQARLSIEWLAQESCPYIAVARGRIARYWDIKEGRRRPCRITTTTTAAAAEDRQRALAKFEQAGKEFEKDVIYLLLAVFDGEDVDEDNRLEAALHLCSRDPDLPYWTMDQCRSDDEVYMCHRARTFRKMGKTETKHDLILENKLVRYFEADRYEHHIETELRSAEARERALLGTKPDPCLEQYILVLKARLGELRDACRRDQKNRHRSNQRQAARQRKREQNGETFTGREPIAVHCFQRRGGRRR
jgi:hypothetical protein